MEAWLINSLVNGDYVNLRLPPWRRGGSGVPLCARTQDVRPNVHFLLNHDITLGFSAVVWAGPTPFNQQKLLNFMYNIFLQAGIFLLWLPPRTLLRTTFYTSARITIVTTDTSSEAQPILSSGLLQVLAHPEYLSIWAPSLEVQLDIQSHWVPRVGRQEQSVST